jgi:hypothetical protein
MDARTLTWLKPLKANPFRPVSDHVDGDFRIANHGGDRVNLTEIRFGGTRNRVGYPGKALRSVLSGPDRWRHRGTAATWRLEADAGSEPAGVEGGLGGVATCHRVRLRLDGVVPSPSGDEHAPPNPGFSWCDRSGVSRSISMPFAVSGSSSGTDDAPGHRRTVPRGRLAGGLWGTGGTGLRHVRPIRRGTGWSAMAVSERIGSPGQRVGRVDHLPRAWWTRRAFGLAPGNTAFASSPVGSFCG